MRKTTIAIIVIVVVGGAGTLVYLQRPFSPNQKRVEHLSRKFMEDLQFKDFRSSSLYHHELDRDRVDIGRTLERLFLVKPEALNIIDYEIVSSEVDSSQKRARIQIRARYKRLNKDKKPQESELMLYWAKRHPDCPIGATCKAGKCLDEFGNAIARKKSDDESVDHGRPTEAAEPAETGDEVFQCDASADRQWFMNLDSTLKEKSYQRK